MFLYYPIREFFVIPSTPLSYLRKTPVPQAKSGNPLSLIIAQLVLLDCFS